jgi:hypothetical protein
MTQIFIGWDHFIFSFESVTTVAFQSVFYLKMYKKNFFYFLKNYFWNQRIKMI